MSFNQLPEVLVAEVASKLNYADLRSLRLSQKRWNKIVKGYHLEEGVIFRMRITILHKEDDTLILRVVTLRNSNLWLSEAIKKEDIDLGSDDSVVPEKIGEKVKKYRFIESLTLANIKVDDALLGVFDKNNTVAQILTLKDCAVEAKPGAFIHLCRQSDYVLAKDLQLNDQYFTDQVFGDLLKNVDFNSVTRIERGWYPTELTDATLNVMLEGRLPKVFNLRFIASNFSFKVIEKLIQKALALGYSSVLWDFGFIGHERENEEIEQFMRTINVDDTSPLKVRSYAMVKYEITHGDYDEERFKIIVEYEMEESSDEFEEDDSV